MKPLLEILKKHGISNIVIGKCSCYLCKEEHSQKAEKAIQEYVEQYKITEEDKISLNKIRVYFGENDKTSFEHWAYNFLNKFVNGQGQ